MARRENTPYRRLRPSRRTHRYDAGEGLLDPTGDPRKPHRKKRKTWFDYPKIKDMIRSGKLRV